MQFAYLTDADDEDAARNFDRLFPDGMKQGQVFPQKNHLENCDRVRVWTER